MEKLHKNANLTNFRQLNYPYTIKIALIKRNQTEQHHFKKKSSAKRTYQNNSAILLPNFTARWHSIRNYLNGRTIRKRSKKKQLLKENTIHLYPKQETQENSEQSRQHFCNSQTNFSRTASA